jgi:multidrug resistance efflux pump
MSGLLDGIYAKDGILILNEKVARLVGAEPVMGEAYVAVIEAQREQAAIEERRYQETSDVNYVINGAKERVKTAMQAAFTKYNESKAHQSDAVE